MIDFPINNQQSTIDNQLPDSSKDSAIHLLVYEVNQSSRPYGGSLLAYFL